ncbi:hypothetical protein A3843_18825 [Pseudovibrio exalbescens]|uniref:Uncharacterized protein n=1 Tax=Pseudovibrio exalbescens TaxID=197461 RepID=A0A1U7JDC7_9HYPH|nr:hypothetical protein A3843_18825 [Pseudovibrio exalbescens]
MFFFPSAVMPDKRSADPVSRWGAVWFWAFLVCVLDFSQRFWFDFTLGFSGLFGFILRVF